MQRPVAAVAAALCLMASLMRPHPAVADQIIGEWCPPGGGLSLVIRNYDDVTFSGAEVVAKLDRHSIAFTVPDGLPDAGSQFEGQQMNDEQVRVTVGGKPAEVWTPCKPIS